MPDLIGFIIIFGVLAVVIGTLAKGAIRIVSFAVLTALALIIGFPILQNSLGLLEGNGLLPPDTTTRVATPPSPWMFLGLLIVFAGLATLVGTLVKGMVRFIGFGILTLLALLTLGGPLQRQFFANFLQDPDSPSAQFQQNQTTQPFPAGAGVGTQADTGTSFNGTTQGTTGSNANGVGGPATPIRPESGVNNQNQTPQGTSGTGNGIPALW